MQTALTDSEEEEEAVEDEEEEAIEEVADDGVASSAETATNASQNSSNELPEPIEHFEMMSEMIGSHLLTGSVHSCCAKCAFGVARLEYK